MRQTGRNSDNRRAMANPVKQGMRSLLFFFGALIKIDVLVPQEQEDRAREVWAELETAPKLIV